MSDAPATPSLSSEPDADTRPVEGVQPAGDASESTAQEAVPLQAVPLEAVPLEAVPPAEASAAPAEAADSPDDSLAEAPEDSAAEADGTSPTPEEAPGADTSEAASDASPATPAEAAPDEAAPAEAGEAPADGEPAAAEAPPKRKRRKKKAKPELPPLEPPPPEDLEGAIEALIWASGDVIRLERLRDLLGLPSVAPVQEAIVAIAARWTESGLAVELEEVAGGVRVVTRARFGPYVERLARRPAGDRLTRTLLETLSIVAYKQPVARAEVERIRGVQVGDSLRGLLERQLVRVVGRSDQPGRPMLYGTTQRFLTIYGLHSLEDLPSAKDLRRL